MQTPDDQTSDDAARPSPSDDHPERDFILRAALLIGAILLVKPLVLPWMGLIALFFPLVAGIERLAPEVSARAAWAPVVATCVGVLAIGLGLLLAPPASRAHWSASVAPATEGGAARRTRVIDESVRRAGVGVSLSWQRIASPGPVRRSEGHPKLVDGAGPAAAAAGA